MYSAPPAPLPPGVLARPVSIPRLPLPLEPTASGTIPAEWIEPLGKPDAILLYIHGGAYALCNPGTHRMITGGIAGHGVRVLSVDYRLSPQNAYPAPIVDCLSAYRYLLAQGVPSKRIFFSGDSAGGNCILASTMYLRDNPSLNIPLPAGLAPLCPWIDLTPSDPTTFLHDEFDSDWLGRGPGIFTTAYFGSKGEKVATERYCSPLHDTSGDAMPPILVSLGTVDRCYGQDLAFFCARPARSGELQVDIYQDQTHVFQFFTGLQQTQICFSRVAAFVKSDPSAHKTAYNWIAYDGTVSPLPGGKEKMRADLAKLLERVEKDEDWKAQKGKEMGPYLRAVGRA